MNAPFGSICCHHVSMAAENPEELELLMVGSQPGHSSSTLNREVDKGLMLRLKPGVFVGRSPWEASPLWIKHRAAAAAVGLNNPSAVLCRETALAVYGVPLLRVPREVQLRTVNRGLVGMSKVTVPGPEAARRFPVRRLGPPVPRRNSAARIRAAYQAGAGASARRCIEVPGVRLSGGQRPAVSVEPLPFVLLDTLPRLCFESAVVALDAALAGRYTYGVPVEQSSLPDVEGWLWSQSAHAAWAAVLRFADARSESPGESRSRVLIDRLGFVPPRLQTDVLLPGGRHRRLDFDWEEDGVVGEFDGKLKYQAELASASGSQESVYWQEKWREDEIEELTGKRFVRWRWQDLDHPARLERRLLLKGVSKRLGRS